MNNNNIMFTIKNNYINYCNVGINISKYEKKSIQKIYKFKE